MRGALTALAVSGLSLQPLIAAVPISDTFDLQGINPHVDNIFSYTEDEGDCSSFPPGTAPQVTPDTTDAFQALPFWSELAMTAFTPQGYELKYQDLHAFMASPTQVGGMGSMPISSYEPVDCAVICSAAPGCNSFNLFVMRAPSQRPNKDQCPNPPGSSYYVCSFWGEVVNEEITTTVVRWADFHVVAAGSNVYNKIEQTKRDISEDTKKCNGAPVVRNGGFEMDDPSQSHSPTGWNITNVYPTVTFGFTKPGSTNNGGTYAFVADMLAPDPSLPDPYTGFMLSQELNTCPGQSYKVSMDYRFDDPADENCSISLGVGNGDDVNSMKMTTYPSGSQEGNRPNVWITKTINFKAGTPVDVLVIFVICDGHVWNNYSIDNVVVDPTN